jgi:hypothetical protein
MAGFEVGSRRPPSGGEQKAEEDHKQYNKIGIELLARTIQMLLHGPAETHMETAATQALIRQRMLCIRWHPERNFKNTMILPFGLGSIDNPRFELTLGGAMGGARLHPFFFVFSSFFRNHWCKGKCRLTTPLKSAMGVVRSKICTGRRYIWGHSASHRSKQWTPGQVSQSGSSRGPVYKLGLLRFWTKWAKRESGEKRHREGPAPCTDGSRPSSRLHVRRSGCHLEAGGKRKTLQLELGNFR